MSTPANVASPSICSNFLQNSCTRGASCRFSHQLDVSPTETPSWSAACSHFLRGDCRFGDRCRQSHSIIDNGGGAEECLTGDTNNKGESYTNASDDIDVTTDENGWPAGLSQPATTLQKPDKGSKYTECTYFARGNCKRGGTCAFQHVVRTNPLIPETNNLSGQHKFHRISDGRIRSEVGLAILTIHALSEPCQFFNRGKCPRGDTCPFLHDDSKLGVPVTEDESLSQRCQFYVEGKCARGDSCPFSHHGIGEETSMATSIPSDICRLNEAGKCTRGVVCPFLHGPAKTKSSVPGEVAEPCQFFGQGKCVRGDCCPFPHVIVALSPVDNASSEPCTYFRLGRCRPKHSPEAFPEDPVASPLDCTASPTENWTDGQGDTASQNRHHEIVTTREPCKYFGWGNCHKGTACQFRHTPVDGQVVGPNPGIRSFIIPCKYFLLGVCRNGSACSYSHTSTDNQDAEKKFVDTWASSDGDVRTTSTLGRLAETPAFDGNDETQKNSAAFRESATTSKQRCKFFPQGNCKYGEACHFVHSSAHLQAYETPSVDPWLTDDRAPSTRGSATRICNFFAQGNCRKGTACTFLHNSSNDQPYQSMGWGTSDETIQPGSDFCEFFQQGNCKEGDACQFQHEKPLDPWAAWGPDESADPCSAWGIEEPSNDWFGGSADLVESNADENSIPPAVNLRRRRSIQDKPEEVSIMPVNENVETKFTIKRSDETLTPMDDNAATDLTTAKRSNEGDCIIVPIDNQAEPFDGSDNVITPIDSLVEPEFVEHSGRSSGGIDPIDSHSEPEFTVERSIFHASVMFGQGAAVRKVVTAFESQLLILSNLPVGVMENDMTDLAAPFGEIARVILETPTSSPPGALIEFIECADAALAARNLDNQEYRSVVLTARLELRGGLHFVGTASLMSRTAKISWSAPSLTGWAHYPTISKAKEQADVLQGKLSGGRKISTSYISPRKRQTHSFTVEIKGLPLDTTREDIQKLCQGTSSVSVAGQTNYDRTSSIVGVRDVIAPYETIDSFHVLPADASKTKIIAFANFSRAESVAAIIKELHRTRQDFLKNNILWVEQVYLAKYDIPLSLFMNLKPNLDPLRDAYEECKIRYCERDDNGQPTNPVYLQIDGSNPKTVARAKKDVEEILRGEPLILEGNDAWDGYFDTRDGATFFTNLNTDTKFFVKCDRRARTIQHFSREVTLEETRGLITRQLRLVRGRRHIIPIARDVIRPLLTEGLKKLQDDNGIDVALNVVALTVTVQGRDDIVKKVKRFLAELSSSSVAPVSQDYLTSDVHCSVCACAIVDPIRLPCRHVYCEICLQHILRSAAGPHFSPLRCIADHQDDHTGMNLPCYADVPYNVIHDLLSEEEEMKLLEFSLLSYVRAHRGEFHFCPTPDCLVVYRPGTPGIVFQCPSCQKRICPSCRVEYHDALSCVEYQDS